MTHRRWAGRPFAHLLRWLLAMLVLACPATPVSAATTVAGPIAVNTLWRAQDGPFDVAADVTVQGGATLTVEAGTQITMRPATSLIVQQGALRVLGTQAAPVLITSQREQAGDTPAPGDWGHIRFLDGTSDGATRIEHTVVRYGSGVTIERASPALNHLRIEHSSGPAIAMDLASSPAGIGLSAQGNALDGILISAGEVLDDIVWGLVGIPYVVADGIVSVGAAPTLFAITPSRIEQGETITATLTGTRLSNARSVAFASPGLTGTALPGGTDTSVSVQITAAASTPLGSTNLELQTAAGRAALASALTVVVPLPAITVTAIDPPSIRRGEALTFTVSGTNLQGTAVSSANPGLSVSAVQSSATQATFTLTAAGNAALGASVLSFSNPGVAKGIATAEVRVDKALPKVVVTPAVLAVPPDSTSRQFRVGLSEADDVDRSFLLTVGSTTIAQVTPAQFTLAAGQTQQTVSVQGLALGQTTLSVTATGLAPLTLPIYVTPDFSSINTASARTVRVERLVGAQPPAPVTVTPLQARAVRIGAGRFIRSVMPSALTIGAAAQELVIEGEGLEGVSVVSVNPAAGITLGDVSAAADGRSVRVLVSVAGDATLGARLVQLAGAHQPYLPVDAAADRILIVPPPPEIMSIEPIVVARGASAVGFVARGRNLQNLQSLRFTPAEGISLGTPAVSSDGTTLSVGLNVAPDAPLGARVVVATTAGGRSAEVASPANTLQVVASVSGSVTPVLAASVRLLKQTPETTPTPVPASILSRAVLVGSGQVVTAITPAAGSIGTSITLVVSGSALQPVSAVQFVPADGLTVGTPAVAADGRSASVDIDIALDAPQTLRRVRVLAGSQEIPIAGSGVFRVTTPQPQVLGLSPIAVEAGAAPVSLMVIGRNFQNAQSVRVLPPDGVTLGQAPAVNADGTQLSVSIAADASAARGPRTVVVSTAAGETGSTRTEANTLSIVQALGPAVSPLLADAVRVVRQTPGGGEPQPQPLGPVLSREVRITLGQVAPQPPAASVTLHAPAASVARGPYATSVQPQGLAIGQSATLVVRGYGLDTVSGAALQPAEGVVLGSTTVSADGEQLSLPITVAPDAASGPRELLLTGASGPLPFVESAASRLGIAREPVIDSIAPISARRGDAVSLTIRGSNLSSAATVGIEPPDAILIEPSASANATGTELTIRLQIAPDAALGARVVRVTTPGGTTPADATAKNTFTVFP